MLHPLPTTQQTARPATFAEAREWLATLTPADVEAVIGPSRRLRPWLTVSDAGRFLDWLQCCFEADAEVSASWRARALADARCLFDLWAAAPPLHPAPSAHPADAGPVSARMP